MFVPAPSIDERRSSLYCADKGDRMSGSLHFRSGSMLFSNSGSGFQALHDHCCWATVLSAAGAGRPHDGVR